MNIVLHIRDMFSATQTTATGSYAGPEDLTGRKEVPHILHSCTVTLEPAM